MVAVINSNECVGCGTCIDECPTETISLNEDNIAIVDKINCLGCGACVDVCPTCAIIMD